MKIFGREPALWLGLIAAVIQVVSATVFELSDTQQAVLNAVAVAVIGFATALAVSQEKIVPALIGLLQAAFAVALAFGWDVPASTQGAIMALVTGAAAMFVRTQVVAPVPPGRVEQ